MSIRKRNEFLDVDHSDADSDQGYDSEEHEEGRGGIGGRASKRRKVAVPLEDGASDGLSEEQSNQGIEGEGKPADIVPYNSQQQPEPRNSGDIENVDTIHGGKHNANPLRSALRAPSAKQAQRAQKAARKSGVVYISRVPPFMKPHTLKHFLEPHASEGIGRIFLTPEDHEAQLRRRKAGGNKKKSFTDGWVEFVSKTEAKVAAEMLNGNIIGGKKGNFYHDDLWNMKYLKGFKWSHLTEQIANENAARAARVREEIRRTRKENQEFLKQIEAGKVAETNANREAKRLAKGDRSGNLANTHTRREFKQRKAQNKDKPELGGGKTSRESNVLSSIF